jgi:hypothetical protein
MVKGLFGFGKKRKMAKLAGKYMDQRIDKKRSFEEQLGELDDRLKKEKIDLQERDRLIFLLQTQFYKQQEKDWEQMQKKYVNPISRRT